MYLDRAERVIVNMGSFPRKVHTFQYAKCMAN